MACFVFVSSSGAVQVVQLQSSSNTRRECIYIYPFCMEDRGEMRGVVE